MLKIKIGIICFCVLLLLDCKPKGYNNKNLQNEPTLLETVDLSGKSIFYDSLKNENGSAPSIYTIYSMASKVLHLKDSLKAEKNITELIAPEDSLVFTPVENDLYNAILKYKHLLSLGVQLQGEMPSLVRDQSDTDSLSLKLLPAIKKSEFLVDKHFFFLGGGPFIKQFKLMDGTSIFKDLRGNPEIRLVCNDNENTKYLLNAILHLRKNQYNVLFGLPLSSYESGNHEIKGIGSLVHELVDRVNVVFITESGLVNGQLVSISHKLAEEYGCISNNPEVIFSCTSIPEKEILGVYLSYDSSVISACNVKRDGKLWVADINGDGIPELAGVSDTFVGVTSDTMAKVTWYINLNGKWKIIDTAEEPDCT